MSPNIIQTVEFLFAVVGNVAGEQVRVCAASGVTTPVGESGDAIGVAAGGLAVDDELIESAHFGGVRSPNLRDVIREAGQVLVRKEAAGPADFEATGIEDGSELAAPAGNRRNLRYFVLEQAGEVHAELGTIHQCRVFKHVGKFDRSKAKDEFVCHRRIEYVSQANRNTV